MSLSRQYITSGPISELKLQKVGGFEVIPNCGELDSSWPTSALERCAHISLDHCTFLQWMSRWNSRRMSQGLRVLVLHVWRGNSETKFQVPGDLIFTFFPALTIQKITPELIRTRMSNTSKVLGEDDEKAGNECNKEANNSVESTSEATAAKQVVQAAADEQKILEKLSSVCSADSGLFVLSDLLNSAARQSMTFGAEHKLYSAQKKGNVLYLQDRVTFRNARIYYGDKLSEMARSDPRPSVRVTRGVGSGQHLASVLQEGRKTRTLMPVWDSSGESRLTGSYRSA